MAQAQKVVRPAPAPAPWHLPRLPWEMLPLVIVLIAIASIFGGIWIVSRTGENTSTPVAVPAIQRPVAQPMQQTPVASTSLAPVVVDYRVTWTEVKDFDPSTIPVEEGFYNGRRGNTVSYSPSNPRDVPEMAVYAWKILPHLEKEGNRNIMVGTARDQSARDIVLVSITAESNFPHILLSADGEKSWCKLTLLPNHVWEGKPNGDAVTTRVASQGGEIHLYAQDTRPGNHWWTATVKKSELPCS